METDRITRGASLVRIGGFVAAALGVSAWKLGSAADSEGAGPAGVASGAVSCVLTPEQTEGPYYVAGEKYRSNITDGRPGVPLLLRLHVVDASTCKPIAGAEIGRAHV